MRRRCRCGAKHNLNSQRESEISPSYQPYEHRFAQDVASGLELPAGVSLSGEQEGRISCQGENEEVQDLTEGEQAFWPISQAKSLFGRFFKPGGDDSAEQEMEPEPLELPPRPPTDAEVIAINPDVAVALQMQKMSMKLAAGTGGGTEKRPLLQPPQDVVLAMAMARSRETGGVSFSSDARLAASPMAAGAPPSPAAMYRDLLEMALADGSLHSREGRRLESAREKYGITMAQHRQLLAQMSAATGASPRTPRSPASPFPIPDANPFARGAAGAKSPGVQSRYVNTFKAPE
jgi:hypothetical protein